MSVAFHAGADINILAELVSGLPSAPPPSLLRASPLGLLLMVRTFAWLYYISIFQS